MTDFAATKAMFHLPEGMIYLDGNSLGPLPKATPAAMEKVLRDEWGEMLITGWNNAGWMAQSTSVGDRVARLIGAEPGHVIMGDTLSVKVYQALASAVELNPDRRVILSDSGNFPSDLYMAEGLIQSLDKGYELRVVAPEDVAANLTDEIAVMMITEVDYRTGRLHDMKALTAKAHEHGVITVWDLAHTAGATDVQLADCKADFAVGCTYKYFNGGPGAPAFIYVNPKHANTARPAMSGWLGHDAPFAFEQSYRPHTGIERMRVGTPPVLALTALSSALDVWDMTNMADVRRKSQELTSLFITEVEARCPELTLATSRDPDARGSQVSFAFEDGYPAMQALIAHGVIGDFRAPNIMRFGFTPLYIDEADVVRAAEILEDIMTNRLWDRDEYKVKSAVT
ncbi:Kynureninase [Shimia gijangensis]|uniref:Kynureninase n=1 Tax=Shimia gijangensis TaxID=1470563 RepID=A0A1M6L152_9RHOB|nr:kynureninase [Shimia gijangensis]SHJ64862.1 Kynureninase [Shimia gijangensis]